MRSVRLLMLLPVFALCSCGGGGNTNRAPQISNLTLSESVFDWQANGGQATIFATFDFSDPEGRLSSVQVALEDGTTTVIPIEGSTGRSGTLGGEITISTLESGVFTAEVWLTDNAGNESNHLVATVTIVGSTRLANLSISASQFDQNFRDGYLGPYTATVNLMTATTTVSMSTEDPNSTVTINAIDLGAGGTSDPLALDVGINTIDVTVTASGDVRSDTYTIQILRNALDLSQRVYIKPTNVTFDDRFGASLDMGGDTLAVTSRLEDSNAVGIGGDDSDNSASNSGAVYLFTRDPGGVWSQLAYVKASNAEANDFFGSSVAIDGDTLAVGAVWERSAATGVNGDQSDNSVLDAGAVYVFTRDLAGAWSQHSYVKASNPGQFDLFGNALALQGDRLVVGAYQEASNATGVNGDQSDNSLEFAGAAYVFLRDGAGDWAQEAYLKGSDVDDFDGFGYALAMDGDTLVVGAPESNLCTGCDTSGETGGKAYVFVRDAGGAWQQQARLQPSGLEMFDRFGSAVAIEGDTIVVGAPEAGGSTEGTVYVYTRDVGGTWNEEAQLSVFNPATFDKFGASLSLRNGALVVGAPGGTGAAYVFARNASQQWEQQAYLRADNRELGDDFGWAVVSVADLLVVGARFEDSGDSGIGADQADNSARESGAVYVFE